MECRTEPAEERAAATARPPLVREFLLVAGLFLVYKFGRMLANGHSTEAFRNAHLVWDWERALHLPGEGSVQSALLHGDTPVHLANVFYADASENETTQFVSFETGRWYRIRLRVTEHKIEAWIEQKKVVDVGITGRKVSLRIGLGRSMNHSRLS